MSPTRDSSLRSMRRLADSSANRHSELGPRSLDSDRSFWSACAELIWDQTSPTDFCNYCNVRATKPELSHPRTTETCISFRGSPAHALFPREAVRRGESRMRPFCLARDGFLSLARACPNAITTERLTTEDCSPVWSEDRRARVEGPSEGRVSRCKRIAWHRLHPLRGVCGRRSPPRRPSDIRCRRRACL